jgi:hypothetical protein
VKEGLNYDLNGSFEIYTNKPISKKKKSPEKSSTKSPPTTQTT